MLERSRRAAHIDFVFVLVGDLEAKPLIEPTCRIDFHHAEGDRLPVARGFPSD
jgi:hypothetical protein